jgi:MscS family membrane protein
VIITWMLIRMINQCELHLIRNAEHHNWNVDKPFADFLSKILKVIATVIATLIIMESLGFSMGSLIAFGGIGGAAIAFASQSMLSNIFGTMTLYMDKPFVIGEYISLPSEDLEGTVESIGWRITMLSSRDEVPIYLPNSVFNKSLIINISRINYRRVLDIIGIDIDSAAGYELIISRIKEHLAQCEDIEQDKVCNTFLHNVGKGFIEVRVDFYLKTNSFAISRQMRGHIMMQLYDIIREIGYNVIFTNDNKPLLKL